MKNSEFLAMLEVLSWKRQVRDQKPHLAKDLRVRRTKNPSNLCSNTDRERFCASRLILVDTDVD
jgi:hypothetical protein